MSKLHIRHNKLTNYCHGIMQSYYHEEISTYTMALSKALKLRVGSSEYCILIDIDMNVMYGYL